MIEGLSFINNQWLWPVLLLSGIVFALFVWKERAKFPSSKFYLSVLASFIAVCSLLLIALQPQRAVPMQSENLILLTEGYDEVKLDSLKQVYNRIPISNYQPGSIDWKENALPKNLFMLGNGVRAYDLWQLDSVKTYFLEDTTFYGITRFNYDPKATLGSSGVFSGVYYQGAAGTKIFLQDPGGNKLDSVVLSGKPVENFQLSTTYKTLGNSLYSLSVFDSLGIHIFRDPFPITVDENKNLKVWMVNDVPSFEAKYLKNYLTDLGYELTIRNKLTKGKFKYEYFNQSGRQGIVFNKEQMAKIDLLIMDAISFRNLSPNARNQLEATVREYGLGVFVQPDASILNSNFPMVEFSFQRTANNALRLPKWPRTVITSYGLAFQKDTRIEVVLSNSGNAYTAYKRLGIGRIGTSTLNGTYELLLNGNEEIYRHIWKTTLQNIGKGFNPEAEVKTSSFLNYPDEPIKIALRTRIDTPRLFLNDSIRIPLRQDYLNQQLWKSIFYPRTNGWHSLALNQDSTQIHHVYVSDTSDWKAMQRFQTLKASQRYFQNSRIEDTKEGSVKEPISLLWFYFFALLSMGYLWLEPKL